MQSARGDVKGILEACSDIYTQGVSRFVHASRDICTQGVSRFVRIRHLEICAQVVAACCSPLPRDPRLTLHIHGPKPSSLALPPSHTATQGYFHDGVVAGWRRHQGAAHPLQELDLGHLLRGRGHLRRHHRHHSVHKNGHSRGLPRQHQRHGLQQP